MVKECEEIDLSHLNTNHLLRISCAWEWDIDAAYKALVSNEKWIQ